MRKKYTLATIIFSCIMMQAFAQPAGFLARGIGGGGALFFPRINPGNDNEYYVACDMSDMFHSTDYGNTYTQLPFTSLQSLPVSTYEFTNNPLIAYSNFNDNNLGYPVKTTDGGVTWNKLTGYDASKASGNYAIFSMKANYNNPNQLLMDYYGYIVFSKDGGNTFSIVATAASMGTGLIMGGALFTGDSIYVGTNQGIYYSGNAGTSFSLMPTSGIPAGEVIWQFAGAKTASGMRFSCITGLTASIYNGIMAYDFGSIAANVYTMDNAAGTWVNKTGTINVANDYIMYVGMAENDVNTIYLGGNDKVLNAPLVYKTTTAGTTCKWSKVFTTSSNANITTGWEGSGGDKGWSWGQSAFGMSVAPMNSNKAMFGSYSDVHLTSDGGATWKQAYVLNSDDNAAGAATPKAKSYHSIGLENTTCWQVFWHSSTAVVAGFSDISGIRSTDGGSSWGYTCNGIDSNGLNSVYRITATPGGTLFAGTSNIHDMYQSTRLKDAQLDATDGNGKIMYSLNGGANWYLLHYFGHPAFWLATDPNDTNTMYASVINYAGPGAAGGIWVTHNLNSLGTSTWAHIANPPRTEGHPACMLVLNDGTLLCTFSGHINPGGAFTNSSGVFIYNPVTTAWSDVSDANMQYWTKDVVPDPSDATQNTWYAGVFTHWGGTASGQGGLYKTINRGATWTKLTGSTYDRVTSVTFNPLNNNEAYLTTETQGLWHSSNMSAATPSWAIVSSYPFRQPERVYFNPYNQSEMWVSSFGNGMKVNNPGALGSPVATANTKEIKLYPNPVKNLLTIELPFMQVQSAVAVYNIAGKLVAQIKPPNTALLQLNTSGFEPGIYVIQCGGKTAEFIKE